MDGPTIGRLPCYVNIFYMFMAKETSKKITWTEIFQENVDEDAKRNIFSLNTTMNVLA